MKRDDRFDVDLLKRDLLDLASADALAAFFARLRFDTSRRTVQQPANLGLSEAVARTLRRVELLGERDVFQVYLVELSSVTMASTRSLSRAFRNLAGEFLLVLTSDYDRIDFVFVDRLPGESLPTVASRSPSPGIAAAPGRPRILTLERRDPSNVAVRVLRRFTWTEPDAWAQADKLRSAYAVAEWSEEEGLFNNRALFSDHYLKTRLREDAVWRDEGAGSVAHSFRDLLLARTNEGTTDETSLRESFFEPALRTLGFHPRRKRTVANDVESPDYELYADPTAGAALGYCLTYPWMRYLDGKDSARDSETPDENPGAVVVSLLQKGDVPWIIVTNGKLWRLYSKRTHSRATSYFEVDLEEVIADAVRSDPDPFRYFWLLFRRQAFELVTVTREGREEQVLFLDRLLLESADYAKELGDRLKGRIFERVFPHLAEGFISRWEGTPSEEDLQRAYRGTLTLLYRLLFLLYAESRDLLPVREVRGYFEKSLARLKKEVADAAGPLEDEIETNLKRAFRADSTALYVRLSELFAVINAGSSDLNVPFYNGGLFSTSPAEDDDSEEADASRFLRDHAVPDRQLAAAIDLLSREDDPKNRAQRSFIDYKSLGVRHLGSIYEGLLEFRLRVATERLGIVREKSRDVYKSWRELDEKKKTKLERDGRFVKRGELYLENDKHERKATGSYYTPDYIVKYIVEHAVGPVVKEKLDALRPRLRDAAAWHRKQTDLAKAKGERVSKYEYGPAVESHWRELIDDVFDIKVLDPAMGSGHFLVEAVDFITDHIIDFLNAFPWNPVGAHLRYTREQILESMQKQNVTIDPQKLTDVNLLKRHVLKRCIYGVDLNPMAVELAKVSLWLDCFTLGAPLSFLDHHLRCGNSLVGVTVEEVDARLREGTQTLLFSGNKFAGVKTSVAGMIAVGEMPDITPDQVQSSKLEYKRASSATEWAKRLLDVYTSQWFGNEVSRTRTGDVNPVLEFLGDKASEMWAEKPNAARLLPRYRVVVDIAIGALRQNRFFNWQLEFPEVFLSSNAPGFDAVIGNPPYIRIQELRSGAPEVASFISARYTSAVANFDISLPFLERGLQLTRREMSFIVPNRWFATDYGRGLRALVRERAALSRVVDFGDHQLFEGATTYTAIVSLTPSERSNFAFVDARTGSIGVEHMVGIDSLPPDSSESWSFGCAEELALLNRLLGSYASLRELRDRAFQGLRTSDNEVYVLEGRSRPRNGVIRVYSDATTEEHEIELAVLKPFVAGDHIRAFSVDHANRWILFPYLISNDARLIPRRELERQYPLAWTYLRACERRLRARERGAMDVDGWWAYGRTQNLDAFEQPKIMLPGFNDKPSAGLDREGIYYNASGYSITLKDNVLLSLSAATALLNSDLLFWILRRLGVALQRGFVEFRPQYLDRLPIALPSSERSLELEALSLAAEGRGGEAIRGDLNAIVAEIYGLSASEQMMVSLSAA